MQNPTLSPCTFTMTSWRMRNGRTSTHVSNSCSQQYHKLVLTLCIHSCGTPSWNIPRNIASHTVDDVYWCWHHTSYIHLSKCLAVDGTWPHPPCNRICGSPHCNNPCRLPLQANKATKTNSELLDLAADVWIPSPEQSVQDLVQVPEHSASDTSQLQLCVDTS